MNVMKNIKNIIKGGSEDIISSSQVILDEYLEFNSSVQRKWMETGDRYYMGDNDIKYQSSSENVDFEVDEQTKDGEANNKLAHSYMKLLVDEKVNYLFSKKYSLSSENKAFEKVVKSVLGKRFGYTLKKIGNEASNKGIGWLQPFINKTGALKFMVIPSEQCCPIWTSNSHDELEAMIRYYDITQYIGSKQETVTKIEYWTENGLEYYEVYKGKLIQDVNAYIKYGREEGDTVPHYSKDGEDKNWGKVPFIPFKNNMIEFPDLRFVKGLIDNYDESRSEVANYLQDVKNLVYVLKGYSGEDLSEFMSTLRKYRAIKIDDDSDGGVDTINPTMDITAAKEHYEQLLKDIEKFSQSIPKDIKNLGDDPSGVALKFHYSGIDLKCNALESEFDFGFEDVLYFIKVYLSEAGKGNFEDEDCEIQFNRDITINTESVVKNCAASKGMISNQTILKRHPWVTDVTLEQAQIEKEKQDE